MTAEEIIGEIKHKKNEEWFDEVCAIYWREEQSQTKDVTKRDNVEL